MHRWRLLRGALGLGVGLAGTVFVGVRTGFTIAIRPELEGDDIPAVPNLIASGYYLLRLFFLKVVHPINSIAVLARSTGTGNPVATSSSDPAARGRDGQL